jgi:histidinol-phosphate aminotransferase
VANFVLIHFPLDKGKTSADADAFLTKRGLVLRRSTITACRTPCV